MKEASEQSEQLREVIRAAYRQGEEAVISLVENLLKAQAEAIGKLESRIKVLGRICKLKKDTKCRVRPK